jgi:hypothetical protein
VLGEALIAADKLPYTPGFTHGLILPWAESRRAPVSPVHAISKALAAADRRLQRWNDALAKIADNKPVELGTLTRAFPGIDERGGEFRAHLQLAALAIALKRRVIILQAVEHAQMDSGNPFENFVRALKADQHRLDKLESGIASVLVRVSALELTRPHRLQDLVITSDEADRLLRASHRIHELGNGVEVNNRVSDVAIEIARSKDGLAGRLSGQSSSGAARPSGWRPTGHDHLPASRVTTT